MTDNLEKNTEEAILEAATDLFIEKGFAQTSTTEIAKKVGCNQAAVHYYYRTKEKLFASIFEQKFKFFIGKFFGDVDDNLPFEEKLAKKIEGHFELVKKNRKLPKFILNEISSNPKRLKLMRQVLGEVPNAMISKLDAELKTEIEKGTIRNMSVYDLLLTIVSLNVSLFVVGPIFTLIADMEEEEFEKMLEARKKEHVRIILASLRP